MVEVGQDCRGQVINEIQDAVVEIRNIQDLDHFMNPREEDILPFEDLRNIEKAAQIVTNGLRKPNTKFVVHYDVDVDGVCSGTQMFQYLRACNANVSRIINKGKKHGLDVLSQEDKEEMIKDRAILIVVDSLDSTIEYYRELCEAGIRIIVLDHHNVDKEIPYDDYVTLVSSARDYGNPELSGAGVVHKFCCYLDEILGTEHSHNLRDLCAVGLVADMMSVAETSYETRALIHRGLDNLYNEGIKKMLGTYAFDSKSIAFSISPKINSSMRMERNMLPVELLDSTGNKAINPLIRAMSECRDEQNEIVAEICSVLEEQIQEQVNNNVFVLRTTKGRNLSGLVANKISASYGKPVILTGGSQGDTQLGSGRGIGENSLNKLVWEAGGRAYGHDNAFGVEVESQDYESFKVKLNELCDGYCESNGANADILLDALQVNDDLIDWLKRLCRVSGMGFPEIKVAIPLYFFDVGKTRNEKHLVIKFGGMEFIQWNFNNDSLYQKLIDASDVGDEVFAIGTLERGFLGRTYSRKMIVQKFIFS